MVGSSWSVHLATRKERKRRHRAIACSFLASCNRDLLFPPSFIPLVPLPIRRHGWPIGQSDASAALLPSLLCIYGSAGETVASSTETKGKGKERSEICPDFLSKMRAHTIFARLFCLRILRYSPMLPLFFRRECLSAFIDLIGCSVWSWQCATWAAAQCDSDSDARETYSELARSDASRYLKSYGGNDANESTANCTKNKE